MEHYIDGINFHDLENQKYWAPPNSWSKEKRQETLKSRVFNADDPWIGSRKMDGAFYKFIKDEDGNMELLGRSKSVKGDYLNKIDWVPHLHPFFESLPNGTCLLGELYFPNNEGSNKVTTIMGCLVDKAIARQEKGEKLNYYIFDCLAFNDTSLLDVTFEHRIVQLRLCGWSGYNKKHYVSYAEFYTDPKTIISKIDEILAAGGEGMVLVRANSLYQPGKRPSKDCMKIKKEIANTIDCFFTGKANPPSRLYNGKEIESWKYWQDLSDNSLIEGEFYEDYKLGKSIEPVTKPYFYGWAGSLDIGVIKDGKVVTIGCLSGLTDEIKATARDQKGKVIEISCMEIMDTEGKGLRHAKFNKFRPDLTIEDCTWEKIYG